MRVFIIILSVIIIIALLLWFTPGGRKIISKSKGQEVDTSIPKEEVILFTDKPVTITKYTLTYPTMPVIPTGKVPTEREAENMLRSTIGKAYVQLTVLKTPYNGITDAEVKRMALTTGRTYKEQLADFIIREISKSSKPFGNINGFSISPLTMNKYIQPPRNPTLCRPGIDLEKIKAEGKYKHFTSKSSACKVNKFISSI